MSDEQQQPLTAEQVLQQLQQQAAANQQAHQKNIDEFVDYSRETQGSDAADSAAQVLVDSLGHEQAQMLAGDLVQYNHPDRLLADLTNDPRLLERFKSMTPHQRAVQLAEWRANTNRTGTRRPARRPLGERHIKAVEGSATLTGRPITAPV